MLTTSSMLSGEGLEVAPTKPVTPGVLRTAPQDSSLRSIRTSRYPGSFLRLTWVRLPFLISVTSSVGTSIWKM